MNTNRYLNNNQAAAKCGGAQKHKLTCLFVRIAEAIKQKHKMTDFTDHKIKEQLKIAEPIIQEKDKNGGAH